MHAETNRAGSSASLRRTSAPVLKEVVHVAAAVCVHAVLPSRALEEKQSKLKKCSILIVRHVAASLCSSAAMAQAAAALASQHVCNVPFMHLTHQLIELSCCQLRSGSGLKDVEPLSRPVASLCI